MSDSKLTCQQVADRILAKMQQMLLRPRMYSSTPESMEETLAALNGVRGLLIHGDADDIPVYAQYLRQQGFGSANFCTRWIESHPDRDSAHLFPALVEFWKEFLAVTESYSLNIINSSYGTNR